MMAPGTLRRNKKPTDLIWVVRYLLFRGSYPGERKINDIRRVHQKIESAVCLDNTLRSEYHEYFD
jgi:hypothetical protein